MRLPVRWWHGLTMLTILAGVMTAANVWFWTGGGHMLPTYWKAWIGDTEAALTLAAFHSTSAGSFDDEAARAAFHWANRAARSGNSDALVALAHAYSTGLGVAQDKEAAAGLYRRAAAADNLEALYAVGFLNIFGEIADRDPEAGERYWERAADLGYREAQAALGRLWLDQPERRAESWRLLKTAAESGHSGASADLARLYADGIGVARNQAAADYWRCRSGPEPGIRLARLCAELHGEPPNQPPDRQP